MLLPCHCSQLIPAPHAAVPCKPQVEQGRSNSGEFHTVTPHVWRDSKAPPMSQSAGGSQVPLSCASSLSTPSPCPLISPVDLSAPAAGSGYVGQQAGAKIMAVKVMSNFTAATL